MFQGMFLSVFYKQMLLRMLLEKVSSFQNVHSIPLIFVLFLSNFVNKTGKSKLLSERASHDYILQSFSDVFIALSLLFLNIEQWYNYHENY